MVTRRIWERCGLAAGAWMGVLLLLIPACPAAAQSAPVTLSAADSTYTYAGDSPVIVELQLGSTAQLAGVDITLSYPADRFLGAPTWENGDLFDLVAANTDGTPGAVKISAAAASGLGVDSGSLGRLVFQAPCQGNAQLWPDGRTVDLHFSRFLAWSEDSTALPATSIDPVVVLNCTTVPAADTSFGTLKAFFGADAGGR